MKYAVNFPNGGAWGDARTLAELAHIAEESGWDGAFLEDYIVWQSDQEVPTYDPWITLAAMAMRTERIRLGTMVTPLARRRPWKVAREAVTLDHLSNGRMILGIGLGDTGESVEMDVSFSHFGELVEARPRAKMLDEALEIIVGLWSGETFRFEGQYYHVADVKFLPKPVQTPHIPIWVGGGWPFKGPIRRAARWDGACLYKYKVHYMTPKDIHDLSVIVQDQRGTLAGYDIAVGGSPRRENWEQERQYIRSLADAGATWWVEYFPPELGDLETVRLNIERGPLRID